MTTLKLNSEFRIGLNIEDEAQPYEYGALSSRFRLYANNKFTAYATMVLHYNQSNHLVVIYSPENSKDDMWTSITGRITTRLDEIFGGEGSFDKYLLSHMRDIRLCYKSIESVAPPIRWNDDIVSDEYYMSMTNVG